MKQWNENRKNNYPSLSWVAGGLLLISLAGTVAVGADDSLTVYRWERPDGTVEFSDEARSGAEPVLVQEPMVVPSLGLKLPPRRQFGGEFSYSLLAITVPVAEVTFRNQQADAVEITGKIEPALRRGHRIFLIVDGAATGKGSRSALFSTARLERGRHTLLLEIRSADDEVLIQSELVGINVQRTVARPAAAGGSS